MEDTELNTGLFKWRKTVLWFLGVAFVSVSMLGFGIDMLGGSENKRFAVTVGETKITHDQFYRARRELEDQYRSFLGPKFQEVLEASGQSINQIVADKLMNEAALDNAAKQYGLSVGREAAAQKLFEQLFPEGYDAKLYSRFLQQKGMTAVQQEELVARELTRAQLAGLLRSFAAPVSKEYTAEVARDLRKFDVVVAELPFEAFNDEPVSDAELQQYYDTHQDELRTPVKVSYEALVVDQQNFPKALEIPAESVDLYYAENQDRFRNPEARKVALIELNAKDSEGANKGGDKGAELVKRREDLIEQLRGGKSFKELSDLFNDNAELKKAGGEKGWITRDDLGSEEAAKIFDAEVSATSAEPVKPQPIVVSSANSEKIFLVSDRRESSVKSLEEVRSAIVSDLQKEQAPALLSAKAEELFASWKDSSKRLSELGQELGIKVIEVKDSVADLAGPNAGAVNEVAVDERLSSIPRLLLEEMDIPRRVVELKGASALVEIRDIKEPVVKPLGELSEVITKKLKEQKAKIKAREVADQLLKSLKDKQFPDLKSAVVNYKLQVKDLKSLVAADVAKELGAPDLIRDFVGISEAGVETMRVYSTRSGFVLPQVMALSQPSAEDVASKVKEEKDSILEQEQNLVVQAFVARYKAGVEKDVDASLF